MKDVFFLDELKSFAAAFPDSLRITIALSDEEVPERPEHRQFAHGDESLGEVLDQDSHNLPMVQKGMNSEGFRGLWIGDQELRIRHFHKTLDDYLYRDRIRLVE